MQAVRSQYYQISKLLSGVGIAVVQPEWAKSAHVPKPSPPCQVNFRKIFLTTASQEAKPKFLMSLPTVPPTHQLSTKYRMEIAKEEAAGERGEGVDVSPIFLESVIGTTSLFVRADGHTTASLSGQHFNFGIYIAC